MPASKRRYGYDDDVAANMQSLKDMFEAPQPKKDRRRMLIQIRAAPTTYINRRKQIRREQRYTILTGRWIICCRRPDSAD